MELTVRIEKEYLSTGDPIYVATCLELDIASQGRTVEEAKSNVQDAVADVIGAASPSEIHRRLRAVNSAEVFLTHIEVPLGRTKGLVGTGLV